MQHQSQPYSESIHDNNKIQSLLFRTFNVFLH